MALALSWTGFADTDLEFSEFFDSDHTLSARFMPQYPNGYEGPLLAENGSGTFVPGQGYWSETEESPVPLLRRRLEGDDDDRAAEGRQLVSPGCLGPGHSFEANLQPVLRRHSAK